MADKDQRNETEQSMLRGGDSSRFDETLPLGSGTAGKSNRERLAALAAGIDTPDKEPDELVATEEGNTLELEPLEAIETGMLEIVSAPAGQVEGGAPPAPPAPPPHAAAGASASVAIADELWNVERIFFQREARALAERQPERAAQMYLEAAGAAERAGQAPDNVLVDTEAALALRPESRWLLPAVRRFFLRHGRFERCLELGHREVELGGENVWRAAVLQESAAVMRFRKGNPGEALKLLVQAEALMPSSPLLLCDAVGLRTELGLHADAAGSLEQLAATLNVAEERALCLFGAATLRDEVLAQPEAAETAYRAATEADRESIPAAMGLYHHAERRALYAQLCVSLEHFAALVRDAGMEARLLHRAGSLHLDRTGDLDMAARDLSRAAQADPNSAEILRRLAYVHEARGRSRELVGTLRRMLALTIDAQGRAALHTHLGWLLQTRLGEIDEAIQEYRHALEAMEGYLPALQSLSTLYRHRGDWEPLLEIYAPETEGSLPAGARAVRCMEMAEILIEQLHRREEAVRWYLRAIELDPGLYPAFWALGRLLRQLGSHEVLADLLARQAERSGDPRTRNHLLLELAQLQSGPQNETERAIKTLEGIREPDHTRSVAFMLLDLYQRAGRFAEMTAFLQTLSRDTSDPAEAQGRLLEAANIYEQKLQEPQKALELYRAVLEQDPNCVLAQRGAGRIYHRLAAWNELVKLYYHELKADPTRPDTAILLCRVGRVLEENLGQISAAIKAYSKALEREPTCAPALPALERMVRGARRWEDLVQVLQSHAAARMDARLAAEVLCRAADVAEAQLEDLPRALNLFLNAQVLYPESVTVRHGLVRVYRRQGNWVGVASLLGELAAGTSSAVEKELLLLELARVREFRLGEAPDAGFYAQVSDALAPKLRLERIRVLRTQGSSELAVCLEKLGAGCLDPGFGCAHLLESVYRRELAGAEGSALEAARQAYRRQPNELAVMWALERALWRERRFSELAQLREKDAKLEIDPTVRVGRLLTAATAHLQGGDTVEARRVAQECLSLDARCVAALRLLAMLAERGQDWAELAALCDRLAEASTDPENRLESCLRAADLWSERVGDVARALASLGVALTEQPAQSEAFARAERLLRANSRFQELSRLYRRRIKSAPEAERVEMMRAHTKLLRDDLRDAGQAIQQLNELLSVAPGDSAALLEVVDLLVVQEHWSEAAAKLAELEIRAGDPELRHHSRLRQAELWLQHLHEPRRAQEILAVALEERPGDVASKRQMAELCRLEGNWDGARQILESLLNEDEPSVTVWAGLQLADVARVGLRDEDLARLHETAALQATLTSPTQLAELVEHYRRMRELGRFVKLGEDYLSQLNSVDSTALRAALGRVLLEELQQPARALEHLRKGLTGHGDDEELRLLLAVALERQGELEPAARECRLVLQGNPASVAAYRTLAKISERRGHHPLVATAAGMIDLLGEADPEETALLKSLEGTGSPAGSLDIASLPLPETLASSQRVLATVLNELGQLFPQNLTSVLPFDHPASAAVSRLARPLGLSGVSVGIVEQSVGAVAGIGLPVQLAINPALAGSPGDGVFRFWVGRALFAAQTGAVLLERLTDDELVDLAGALCGAKALSTTGQQRRKELSRILPRKVRKQLESAPLPVDELHWAALRDAERMRADKVGMLFSRSPRDGLTEIGRLEGRNGPSLTGSPRIATLLRFVLSDEYASQASLLWA